MFLVTLLTGSIFFTEPVPGTFNSSALFFTISSEERLRLNKATSQVNREEFIIADYCSKQDIVQQIAQKDSAREVEDLSREIRLNPNNSSAYYRRGFAFFELGRYEEAIEDLSRSIQLNPNDAISYMQRGETYRVLREYRRAIEDFTRAAQLNNRIAFHAYTGRGLAYHKLGNYRAANEDFSRAIQLNPNFADAYLYRAGTWRYLGQGERISEDLRRAIELDSTILRLIEGNPRSN